MELTFLPSIQRSSSLPNVALGSENCGASEIWIIPELSASPTVYGREIRHFFSISTSESDVTEMSHHSLPEQSNTREYRFKVLRELYESERTYVCNLGTVFSTFLPALSHTMPPKDLRCLIPTQLESLLGRHTEILARLREQITLPTAKVGELFCSLCNRSDCDLLNIYCAYFNNFAAAMKTLDQYERSHVFCEAVQSCQPHSGGLNLAAFLLTPVQRLPRYELLLKELLKHTPENHEDYQPLHTAVQLLKAQMLLLNSSIRSCQLSCLKDRQAPRQRRSSGGSQPLMGDLSRHTKTTTHRRTYSHGVLNFSLGMHDFNDEDPSAESLAISCSDLILDFKDTPPCNSTDHFDDSTDSTPSQPISIGSPMQFRHIKHVMR